MSERLSFRRLIIIGPSRNYEVRFRDGVNIIAGPVMTGKSSALKLLDYVLGSSRMPAFPEIAKCTTVLVEMMVGGETLTIRRSLKSVTAPVELFESPAEAVLNDLVKGTPLAAKQSLNAESVSTQLMRRLGWGKAVVKTAPTRAASDTSTFSLRDLSAFPDRSFALVFHPCSNAFVP